MDDSGVTLPRTTHHGRIVTSEARSSFFACFARIWIDSALLFGSLPVYCGLVVQAVLQARKGIFGSLVLRVDGERPVVGLLRQFVFSSLGVRFTQTIPQVG